MRIEFPKNKDYKEYTKKVINEIANKITIKNSDERKNIKNKLINYNKYDGLDGCYIILQYVIYCVRNDLINCSRKNKINLIRANEYVLYLTY